MTAAIVSTVLRQRVIGIAMCFNADTSQTDTLLCMTPRRVVFIDIDGTLVDYNFRLPESARAAVIDARTNGHLLYMCTGRSLCQIEPELRALGFHGIISGDGSYVCVDDLILRSVGFNPHVVEKAVTWFDDHRIPWYLEGSTSTYGCSDFYERVSGTLNCSVAWLRKTLPDVQQLTSQNVPTDISKMSFALSSPNEMASTRSELGTMARFETWNLSPSSTPQFGALIVPGIDKRAGAELVLSHIGESPERAVAIGDSANDLPMFSLCGTAIAMGNAEDRVKAAASWVTGAVGDDGLAAAFRRMGFVHC